MLALTISFLISVLTATTLAIDPNTALLRAAAGMDRLVTCSYSTPLGMFIGDQEWQTGNTLETLGNLLKLSPSLQPRFASVLSNSFAKTPVVVDQCFDDHQWWLLGWIRAYEATGDITYAQRAAQVFDYVSTNGWETTHCGGGVIWCPVPTPSQSYKNAITVELFFASAMELSKYESVLNRTKGYYVQWGHKIWSWIESSGMINSQSLLNDGLSGQCTNNGGTTWTYNQGVILSALSQLATVTQNKTMMQRATSIMNAVFTYLTSENGILVEPTTGGPSGDNFIFKGVFVRHLGYMSSAYNTNDTAQKQSYDFLSRQTNSIVASGLCSNGYYSFSWEGPCDNALLLGNVPTTSAAIDAFLSYVQVAKALNKPSQTTRWSPVGLGNCIDSANRSMPNCNRADITEAECQAYALADLSSVGYDYEVSCLGVSFCRVRTLAGSCDSSWTFEGGDATNVTSSNNSPLAYCVKKVAV